MASTNKENPAPLGKRFGKWTVINAERVVHDSRHHQVMCRCDCGAEQLIYVSNLVTGRSTQCGSCTRREQRLKNPRNTNRMVVTGAINRLPKLPDDELARLNNAVINELFTRQTIK